MAASPLRCDDHGAEPAGWRCAGCEGALCVRCAVRRRAGHGTLVACRRCGGFANPLLGPRARTAFTSRLAAAFAFPFSARGITLLVAMAAVLALLRGVRAGGLAAGVLFSYLFLVVRTTARGDEELPDHEDFSHPWELFGTLARLLVALATAAIPFFLYAWLVPKPAGLELFELPAWFAAQQLTWVTLGLGILWSPMAVLLAATHSPLGTILHPLVSARAIGRLGADYVLLTGIFWGFVALSLHAAGLAARFPTLVPVPLVSTVFAGTMALYLPVVLARVMGTLLHLRGAEIGYGTSGGHLVPVLGALQPAEELPSEPARPPEQAAAAPVEIARIRPVSRPGIVEERSAKRATRAEPAPLLLDLPPLPPQEPPAPAPAPAPVEAAPGGDDALELSFLELPPNPRD